MSHVVEIDLAIKDLPALAEACKCLGLELVMDQHTYKWFGRSVGDYPIPTGYSVKDLGKCDHAIRIPDNKNAYEMGVVKARGGKEGYALIWDFFAGGHGLQEKVGKDACKLTQAYQKELFQKTLPLGFKVTQSVKASGDLVLEAVRY
jgi:hypothetical protein